MPVTADRPDRRDPAGASDALADRVREAVTRGVEAGDAPGAAWYVRRGGAVTVGAAGTHGPGRADPVHPDSVFRISSMTKPVVAALAMALVDDGALDLDAPVDDVLPELADRRVLADPADPAGPTVPARRPITVRDVLELRLGTGMDFTAPWPNPYVEAMTDAGVPTGPPQPDAGPPPDEWIRRLGTLPLAHQPGERWLYHTGSSVLGVLLARVGGRPLPDLLEERVLRPLGMHSTGFGVPDGARGRLGPHWAPTDDGVLRLYDPPDGQWSHRPAFPDAGDGLVSTVGDLAALAAMLRSGGRAPDDVGGVRVLSERAVHEMTTERVGPVDDEGGGWGLGIGVRRVDEPGGRHAGSHGWEGGMGSTWWTDPVSDVTAILLTNLVWPSAGPPPLFARFRAAAFGAP